MEREAMKRFFESLLTSPRRPVRITADELVQISPPNLPVVLTSQSEQVDLVGWLEGNHDHVLNLLRSTGGVLFRGFGIETPDLFAAVGGLLSQNLMGYGERSSPRTRVAHNVYTSTDHPQEQPILLHTEQSYTLNWPMKIMFCCVTPASSGGRTPIADTRRILASLPDKIVERFAQRQVRYVRHYGFGLGLRWQDTYQTSDLQEVERHCRSESIDWEWLPNGALRTLQIRPAVRLHPVTGEKVWFNHALFFHFTGLTEETQRAVLSAVPIENVPFNTFYGDGGAIEAEVLSMIREAYDSNTVAFDWHAGDVLVLDNMLTAHGRESFTGPRQVLTIMADPYRDQLGS